MWTCLKISTRYGQKTCACPYRNDTRGNLKAHWGDAWYASVDGQADVRLWSEGDRMRETQGKGRVFTVYLYILEVKLMYNDLTPKQINFLKYLKKEIKRRGRAPSLREAASDLNISHTAVAQFIRILESKGFLRRDGRYGRMIHLLAPDLKKATTGKGWRQIPIIGKIAAGLPLYAQQEWDSTVIVDANIFRFDQLFALRVRGDSMKNAGILQGDLVICEPRQFANDGEIVVALINGEEATVKRFFLKKHHIELCPENEAYPVMQYGFGEVLIQGKVIGVQRGPEHFL